MVYHGRRKQTNYMVGIEDLEEPLCLEIQRNSENVKILQDQIHQQSKEFTDYKRFVETMQSNKDNKFEMEVRGCLSEQLHYINELQNDMDLAENKNKREMAELRYQFQTLERETFAHASRPSSPNVNFTTRASKKHVSKQSMDILGHQFRAWVMQSTELQADFLKIQNILNFEFHRLLQLNQNTVSSIKLK